MANAAAESTVSQKLSIEALSKDEILTKYKSLLGIAKKAKQAKDEYAEENRKLKETISMDQMQKEANTKAMMTMEEMLAKLTDDKLQMVLQLTELQQKSKKDDETITQLGIETESLRRQLGRLTEDNDNLLLDIDKMEGQLNQVNLLGKEQKKHLELLELEVNKLKEAECLNASLQSQLAVTLEENKSIKEKMNMETKSLNELTAKYNDLKEVNSEQRKKFNALKERFVEVSRKLKNLKECKRILLETQYEYSEAVSQWQIEIINASKMLCAQLNALKAENEELKRKLELSYVSAHASEGTAINVDSILSRLNEIQHLSDAAHSEQRQLQQIVSEHEEEITRLKATLISTPPPQQTSTAQVTEPLQTTEAETQSTESQYESEKLKETIIGKLEQELEQLRVENKEVLSKLTIESEKGTEIERLHCQIDEMTTNLSNIQEAYAHQKLQFETLTNENARLLSQVKQQNEVIEVQQLKNEENVRNYEELLGRFEAKEREHTDLLDEMRELNEALKARGDAISRQQEKQQELIAELKKTSAKLRLIEDKLNEKEQGLVQKDEQVRAVSKEVDEARLKVSDLEMVCVRNEQQVRLLNEEIQNLRGACEMATDNQSDALSTSTISRADELSRLSELDDGYEGKYHKLRGLAMKLKRKVQEQSQQLEELHELRNQIEEQKKALSDVQHERDQGKKLIDTLKAENQKLKCSRKQANVLNLEIEAAEKSLNDATAKLNDKCNELEELREVLTVKENTISQLRKEIAILESVKETEVVHARELKEQIDHLNKQVKDALHHKENTVESNKQLEQALENVKLEVEELRLQLANVTTQKEATLGKLSLERSELEGNLMECQERLHEANANLKLTERTLEELRVEYTEYKMKAQAVLRKNQNVSSKERELEEEIATLHASEQQWQESLQMHMRKIENYEDKMQGLHSENQSLQVRNNELQTLVEDLKQRYDNAMHENHLQIQKHQESLKLHREQIDSLNNSYKVQLNELESKYQQLKKDYDQAMQQSQASTIEPPTLLPHVQQSTMNAFDESKHNYPYPLMAREDAEGSEEAEALAALASKRKISNASRRRSQQTHDFLPLDELLNVPMNAISDTITTLGDSVETMTMVDHDDTNNNLKSIHTELQATKEHLHIQESRVRHLTALLAENEQDLAKLTQLNDMLKEELRRQERAVEREKHITENSEYLKNVIIKFITLNNNDERIRLVPVLNTILRLSRSETEMLNCVARGQKVPSDGASRGWSDFLPKWGNHN